MRIALIILIAAGLPVICLALRAHWRTSLLHALIWTLIAWLSWGIAFARGDAESAVLEPSRYCALCLTGCAGVAVLGARRPHVRAWNFVVLGLFSVMVLPLIETLFIGTHPVDGLRIAFLAGTIAVGVLNYLPTRLGPGAFVLMIACAGEIVSLFAPTWLPGNGEEMLFDGLLTAVPWLGWLGLLGGKNARHSEFDRLWRGFRDSWGLMWSQRVREQFNRAAHHAGWPVTLRWRGLAAANLERKEEEKYADTLRATLQRFLGQIRQ